MIPYFIHKKGFMVDLEDVEKIKDKCCQINKKGYIYFHERINPGQKPKKIRSVYLHRFVLNAKLDQEIDHINRNKLDNRKSNLRIVNSSQNGCNKEKPTSNTSGYKNVTKYRNGKYRVSLGINGKHVHVGYFSSLETALNARDKALDEHHGIFGVKK